jgi:hypothetical protein
MKQVDFDVRVWNLVPAVIQQGTQTREDMLKFMKENYPAADGWKIESVSPAGINGGAISVLVFAARYVEDAPVAKAK